jgi:CRISPR-associated exonuclease Cas4
MFKTTVNEGAIFSAMSRRRHLVAIDSALRQRVILSAQNVQAIMVQEQLPPAASDRRCRRCSMNHTCLPKVMAGHRAFAAAVATLFTVSPDTAAHWND